MMQVGPYTLGLDKPLLIMAGPCVVESESLAMETAGQLKEITSELGLPFIYKSSFIKANRSSHMSFSGLGIDKALSILAKVKKEVGVMIVTDVHEDTNLDEVCEVADVLQTPAFLCRQTAFIQKVAATGLPVNIKKGQFLAPWDMKHVVAKARAVENHQTIMVCERGVSFGYNNLVSDMRSLTIMRECQAPVIFDATHSVQLPGGQGASSGGQREFVPTLAKAAVAVGIHGLFMETHPDPDKALSDGPNAWPLGKMKALLSALKEMDELVKRNQWIDF